MSTRSIAIALGGVVLLLLLFYWIGSGGLGRHWGAGEPTEVPRNAQTIATLDARTRESAQQIGVGRPKQILFGDLHVHSTFSLDAFMMAMPLSGGEGAHPVSDACDYARHCSSLDFWSINDHAVAIGEREWAETIEAIRQCNAIAPDPANPDTTAFLGWEWTQFGTRPGNHYGHKNVILRGLADDEITARPIGARPPADAWDRSVDGASPGRLVIGAASLLRPNQDTFDLIQYFDGLVNAEQCPDGVPVRDLPTDCRETTLDPAGLFAKLDDWGVDSMVIPHGTTWGFYTPQGSAWDKQLVGDQHDPDRQTLIEIYSGHGNSEEYRDWREVLIAEDGSRSCPEPRDDFLPSCWRAGELIAARCQEAGLATDECERRAAEARDLYVKHDVRGFRTVIDALAEDWLDSGQCRDCFQPSFNYRPRSSAQYIMALRNFDDPQAPRRFDFGFMSSSDNHTARPGTGFKEKGRVYVTEARLTQAAVRALGEVVGVGEDDRDPTRAHDVDPSLGGMFFDMSESERASSFFLTGGLMAVHSNGRSRDQIWEAMQRKEVYGTSGPRILLWFDLLNAPGSTLGTVPMGGEARMSEAPIFQVRAVGSFEQEPGCPEDSISALGDRELERICRGECYNPTDTRRPITRIEVVRIRPQQRSGEPVDGLIEDVWKRFECNPDPSGCSITFSDADFASGGRDALYYVRAIEAPIMAINADGARCRKDERGRCVEVNLCTGDAPVDDDCLSETEQRAWSSPIFVEWGGA